MLLVVTLLFTWLSYTFRTPPLCLEGFLRCSAANSSSGCRNMQNASKAANHVWLQIKANFKIACDTFPHSKISNKMQQFSWFTSFATGKNTLHKHPLNSDCTSKSTLMDAMLIRALIRADRCLMSVLFMSLFTQKWIISQFCINRLLQCKKTVFAVYCPALCFIRKKCFSK